MATSATAIPMACPEALQEDRAQRGYEEEGDPGVPAVHPVRSEKDLHDVCGGVRSGQGDRDQEVGGREAAGAGPTKIFPAHQGSSHSSIAIEPSPWGLSLATRR